MTKPSHQSESNKKTMAGTDRRQIENKSISEFPSNVVLLKIKAISLSLHLLSRSLFHPLSRALKMAGPKQRKRVEAETSSLKRARDGSAFIRWLMISIALLFPFFFIMCGLFAEGIFVPFCLAAGKDESHNGKLQFYGLIFTEECKKDVPVVLIDMHSCSLEAKIKLNLEAQVVEKVTDVKKKPAEKKNATTTEPKPKKSRRLRKVKDPNMPKRPPTAFFLFMDDFRKEYKESNPDSKNVSVVAKEGGEKWKSMTDEEKKPYVDKAAELKAEYDKAMETYNAENGEEEGGSGKEADLELIDDE
ncbi:High mobility group B protein 7 [Vitis vinifera]|uniref:High mobility group B protein 7 n=1 Tax=Vitis vinifera TaxID=29760 RepID=A0A438K542_VITVI|nr:High mobility group B protein 7 [Vitis vinifera]